jgi:hypothetical protein
MPSYTYSLTAANVPVPIAPSAQTLQQASVGTPVVAISVAVGQDDGVAAAINEISGRTDLAGRFGGGAYAIVKGLDLDQSVAGTLIVRAGQAMIDGIVEKTTDQNVTLTAGSTTWVWLTKAGNLTALTGASPPAAPASQCAYLGQVVVNGGGTITGYDLSGVTYLRGGMPVRRTGDTGCPADTPPSNYALITQCTGCSFLWDGTAYCNLGRGGRAALTFSSDANKTLTAAETENEFLDFVNSGTALSVTRNVVVSLLGSKQWTVRNNSAGGQSIQVIGSSGTGITIATGKTAIVRSDGTNIVRVTADL